MLGYKDVLRFDDRMLALYESSFTEEEKVPVENLYRAMKDGAVLTKYDDGGEFIGMTYVFIDDDRMFFVYFATAPEVRGKGYGSQIIDCVRRRYPKTRIFFVLEPEDKEAEDNGIRIRRHGFYERNGCRDTGVQLISDNELFDSMFMQGKLTESEMIDTLELYEDVHNGRV